MYFVTFHHCHLKWPKSILMKALHCRKTDRLYISQHLTGPKYFWLSITAPLLSASQVTQY